MPRWTHPFCLLAALLAAVLTAAALGPRLFRHASDPRPGQPPESVAGRLAMPGAPHLPTPPPKPADAQATRPRQPEQPPSTPPSHRSEHASIESNPSRPSAFAHSARPPRVSPKPPTSAAPATSGHPRKPAPGPRPRQLTTAPEPPPLPVPFSPGPGRESATIPAALANNEDPSTLDPAAHSHKETLAANFLAALQDTSENPHDPAYQDRWTAAQEDTDARLRASLGGHTWLQLHRQARHQALAPPAQEPPPEP